MAIAYDLDKLVAEIELDFAMRKEADQKHRDKLKDDHERKIAWLELEVTDRQKFYFHLEEYKRTKDEKHFNAIYGDLEKITKKLADKFLTKKLTARMRGLYLYEHSQDNSSVLWEILLKVIERWEPGKLNFYSYYEKAVSFFTMNIIRDSNRKYMKDVEVVGNFDEKEIEYFNELKDHYQFEEEELNSSIHVQGFYKKLKDKEKYLCMALVLNEREYSIDTLAKAFGVSRGSMRNDINNVKKKWSEYDGGNERL